MTKEEVLSKIKELEDFIKNDYMDDDEIFLLSIAEYQRYKEIIPVYYSPWWLRSPGANQFCTACVDEDGSVYYYGYTVGYNYGCARPALRLSNLESANIKIGDRIIKYAFPWIKIDNDLAIAEVPIGIHRFDSKSNDYKASEIRKYLNLWKEKR